MTEGKEALPAFTNLKIAISDGYNSEYGTFTNGTWTITKK